MSSKSSKMFITLTKFFSVLKSSFTTEELMKMLLEAPTMPTNNIIAKVVDTEDKWFNVWVAANEGKVKLTGRGDLQLNIKPQKTIDELATIKAQKMVSSGAVSAGKAVPADDFGDDAPTLAHAGEPDTALLDSIS